MPGFLDVGYCRLLVRVGYAALCVVFGVLSCQIFASNFPSSINISLFWD